MHIRPLTKSRPQQAQSIEVVLAIIGQIIGLFASLENLLGFDISRKLGTTN